MAERARVDPGLPRPIPVVAGADDAAGQKEDGIEINHPGGREAGDHAEFVEEDGDHGGDEELEEPLHPEMNDPEPPHVHHGKMGLPREEEGRQVKEGNGRGGEQKQGGDLALFGIFPHRSHRPDKQKKPEEQSHDQQELPPPPEVEILPSLVAEPEPPLSRQLEDPEHFAEQTAEDDDREGGKKEVDPTGLPFWLAFAEGCREKKAAPHIAGGDPENGRLQMPGAEDIAGKKSGEVQPVKGSRIGPVMRRRASDEDLGEKEKDRHDEKFYGRPLAFRRPSRQELRMEVLSRSLPSEKIELAEDEKHGRGAGQQHHEAQGAPEIGAGGRPVADGRVIGEIGGIGVILSRTVG